MRRPGVSVIEVIIAIGLAAIVIAAVGNLVSATHRLTSSTSKEIQATGYAKQWLEIISAQANQQFGTNAAASYTASNGQTCSPRSSTGFTSCWVFRPVDAAPFSFTASGNSWVASDTINNFTRTMTVTTLPRNASGVVDTSGAVTIPCTNAGYSNTNDCNTKKITVAVSWVDGGTTRSASLSSILTAWKNF